MKKDILKRFLIYGILPSLITTFIFYTILTTYLSKTFNQLEEEVENIDDKLDSLNKRIDELYLR